MKIKNKPKQTNEGKLILAMRFCPPSYAMCIFFFKEGI